ncbi:fibronectin type III domain-containing protein [Gelidibacter sp.]|uniref:fibronectin type III domain-containing protein n=1 Tax=Gelidibacter sp. TaxID=2018083 RepID=UPI003266694A
MNLTKFLTVLVFALTARLSAQDLHSSANAASVNNEANSTSGWTGLATLTSDSSDPQLGSYAIKAVSTANDGRTVSYRFSAVIGQAYTVRIWAKYGPRVNNNSSGAFAVWTGLSGWDTTPISGTVWREYVFNVTATSTNPTIVAYTNSSATKLIAGNTILIDNVSILPTGVSDTQAPTAPSNLTASGTTTTTTNLSWTASTDNVGVTGYSILQNGTSIGTTTGATTFNVTGLTQGTSYSFTITARDAAGNVSQVSNTANVTTLLAGDTQAPTAPSNLTASGTTTTTTNLSWTASTDNVGVTGYTILRNGTSIGTTTGATSFNVTGLTQGTSYAFTVTARDAAGNVSQVSNIANVTTLLGGDTQAPTAPSNLTASGTTNTTTNLSWTTSTDNVGVTGYTILRNGTSVGTTTGATNFNVTGLTQGTAYSFTVTARDAAGNVSPSSNTVNVTTTGSAGIIDYTSENSNLITVDWKARDLFADRNVGIGTVDTHGYRLAVAGKMVAEEVNVKLKVNWPDYVFEEDYILPSLKEVEKHILQKGYLLNMPSAQEVAKEGIDIGKMNAKLLRKIEELTLYAIDQEKKIQRLEQENKRIDSIADKLMKLEQFFKENHK